MTNEELKRIAYEANMLLPEYGLVNFTWGNVSAADRERGLIAIKPSGVEYSVMTADDMVILDMSGRVVEGDLTPSMDTATHLELYRAFPDVGGIVHTHSTYATAWAQTGRGIPCLGTTHADTFYGEIPCARELTDREIGGEYEKNTGSVIIETFVNHGVDPTAVPGVICSRHGPFAWGKDAKTAVYNAAVLEKVAQTALYTLMIEPDIGPVSSALTDKHYLRKHGADAYYGQR